MALREDPLITGLSSAYSVKGAQALQVFRNHLTRGSPERLLHCYTTNFATIYL